MLGIAIRAKRLLGLIELSIRLDCKFFPLVSRRFDIIVRSIAVDDQRPVEI